MSRRPAVIELAPAELEALLDAGETVLVDVREAFEHWLERIAGSDCAPLSTFDPSAHAGRAHEVVLYCRSGHRSERAAARLGAARGRAVRHLAGGILAWKASGRPVERWGGPKKRSS
jgi:rhodanese-related sulfurtransferase